MLFKKPSLIACVAAFAAFASGYVSYRFGAEGRFHSGLMVIAAAVIFGVVALPILALLDVASHKLHGCRVWLLFGDPRKDQPAVWYARLLWLLVFFVVSFAAALFFNWSFEVLHWEDWWHLWLMGFLPLSALGLLALWGFERMSGGGRPELNLKASFYEGLNAAVLVLGLPLLVALAAKF